MRTHLVTRPRQCPTFAEEKKIATFPVSACTPFLAPPQDRGCANVRLALRGVERRGCLLAYAHANT